MAISLAQIEIAAKVRARLQSGVANDELQAFVDEVGIDFLPAIAFSSGNGDDAANRILFKRSTVIASGNNLDLNMRTGANWDGTASGEDLIGNTLTLTAICTLMIHVVAGPGSLVIGGLTGATGWVYPFGADEALSAPLSSDSVFFVHKPKTGFPVDGTANLLRLAAQSGNVTIRAVALARQ
jgi:hypothetical protein